MNKKNSHLQCAGGYFIIVLYYFSLSLQSGLYLHDRLPEDRVVGELVAHGVHRVEHRGVRAFTHVGSDFVKRMVGEFFA